MPIPSCPHARQTSKHGCVAQAQLSNKFRNNYAHCALSFVPAAPSTQNTLFAAYCQCFARLPQLA